MVTFNDETIHNWGAYCNAIIRAEDNANEIIARLIAYNNEPVKEVIPAPLPKSHGLTGVFAEMEAELEAIMESRLASVQNHTNGSNKWCSDYGTI